MEIVFFYRVQFSGGMSIEDSFKPMIRELTNSNDIKEFHVPYRATWPWNLLRNIVFIRKHSTKTGINHITGDIHYGILGLIGRKSVLTIHDDYAMKTINHGFLEKIYRWLFWIYLPIKYAGAVICISPMTKECIKNYYNSKKLKVITHHCFPLINSGNKKEIDINRPRILNIGTTPNKNLETTLKALKGMPCQLVVLKPMTQEQKKMADEYEIDYINRVDIPFDEVIKEYNECDIVVSPSLYEGLGMPIAEAQSAGKPVITTNKEPMSWVAGGAALLLDNPMDVEEYKNKINELIKNTDLRESLIVKGYDNINRFSLQEVLRKYTEVYLSL